MCILPETVTMETGGGLTAKRHASLIRMPLFSGQIIGNKFDNCTAFFAGDSDSLQHMQMMKGL